jgi:hypothetical protein
MDFIPSKPRKTPGKLQENPKDPPAPEDFSAHAPRSQSENVFQLRSDPDPTSSYEIMEIIPLEMGSSDNPCPHPIVGIKKRTMMTWDIYIYGIV